MRKKTIKSYFFNSITKNPSMNSLFCFSKRAVKQRRQFLKLKKKLRSLKSRTKKKELVQYAIKYKNSINVHINFNQWQKNQTKLGYFFLKSYYIPKYLKSSLYKRKKYRRKHLILWLVLKNTFYKKLRRFLYKYVRIGFLSSHYVHLLSRKNLTYQTRSKYRSKTSNCNFFNYYTYYFSKFIHVYLQILNTSLYFFTRNSVKRTVWLDNDFYVKTSNWCSNKLTDTATERRHFINIQPIDTVNFTNKDLNLLYNCRSLIQQFFVETNTAKKDSITQELLQILNTNTFNYIFTAKLFISPECGFNSNNFTNLGLITLWLYHDIYLKI